jgi:EpsI family protein
VTDRPYSDPKFNRRNMLLGGALLATAGLAYARTPRTHYDLLGKGKLEEIIPKRIGPYEFQTASGLVLPPEDQMRDQLYAQILTRVYASNDHPPVMLLIAQGRGQDGTIQIHRPEVCYPAGGYWLSDVEVNRMALPGGSPLPTRRFTAVGPDRTEQLLYWTRIGRLLPTSWLDQRMAVFEENMRGYIPDAVLVRISVIGADRLSASRNLEEFGRMLIGAVAPATRRFLIGAPA